MPDVVTTVTTLITTVGFPIAAYILLFHSLRTDLKQLTETLNQNTIATTNLVNEIKGGTKDGK